MNNVARSSLECGRELAVAFKERNDNPRAAVDVWAIKFGGEYFLANLIIPHDAPTEARWLFGSITTIRGDAVWGYKDDLRVKKGFLGHVFVVVSSGVGYLVYATKETKPRVAHVVPLVEIITQKEVQHSIDVTIALKRAIADQLGYETKLSETENLVIKHLVEQERRAEEKRREEEKTAREAARQARVSLILDRKSVMVFAGGRSVTAIPVYEDEWPMLPPRTEVVLGKKGEDGLFYPMEVFVVFKDFRKRGSEPEKSQVRVVGTYPARDGHSKDKLPEPAATKVVLLQGRPFEVPSFPSVDDVRAHQRAGLNSDSLRGVLVGGGIDLYRVRKSGLERVSSEDYVLLG